MVAGASEIGGQEVANDYRSWFCSWYTRAETKPRKWGIFHPQSAIQYGTSLWLDPSTRRRQRVEGKILFADKNNAIEKILLFVCQQPKKRRTNEIDGVMMYRSLVSAKCLRFMALRGANNKPHTHGNFMAPLVITLVCLNDKKNSKGRSQMVHERIFKIMKLVV
jgi:hypothetical protein